MRKETKYIADDGTIFEYSMRCFKYEMNKKWNHDITKDLTLLDYDKNELTEWKSKDKDSGFGDFNVVSYVKADSYDAVDYFNEVESYIGGPYIPGKGVWYLDHDEDKYISVFELRKFVKDIFDAFDIHDSEM